MKILIICGGASGMLCALKSAEKGADVTVVERNERVGKKLLATGNGKCNLSNLGITKDAYNDDFVANVLSQYDAQKIMAEFASLGLLCKADSEGRVYPYSESATTVLNVLLQRLAERNVNVVLDCVAQKIEKKVSGFKVVTSKGEYYADKVVLATGSDATSGLNSHSLLSDFGHKIVPLNYAITPLLCKDVKGANGVRAKVYASIAINGIILMGENGELLFKDNALSGVLAFRLSSMLARYREKVKSCRVKIDFVPDMSEKELADYIFDNCSVYAPLEGILHKALASNVLATVPMDRSLIMSRKKAEDIAHGCKNFQVNVSGVGGKSNAQVASGGIALEDIDDTSLQSRQCKGLYIIGEAVDVDGLCGGFNLHWAWASALACSKDML
ncbi:MAG: aminoacetone oxidase family FAD-binding enzyme [Clostridia bacterium]|nr:aminoacetone oxidase family FAD-binding enzyme [Clostridia bacterium]